MPSEPPVPPSRRRGIASSDQASPPQHFAEQTGKVGRLVLEDFDALRVGLEHSSAQPRITGEADGWLGAGDVSDDVDAKRQKSRPAAPIALPDDDVGVVRSAPGDPQGDPPRLRRLKERAHGLDGGSWV